MNNALRTDTDIGSNHFLLAQAGAFVQTQPHEKPIRVQSDSFAIVVSGGGDFCHTGGRALFLSGEKFSQRSWWI